MGDWNLGGITLVVGFLALLGLIQFVELEAGAPGP